MLHEADEGGVHPQQVESHTAANFQKSGSNLLTKALFCSAQITNRSISIILVRRRGTQKRMKTAHDFSGTKRLRVILSTDIVHSAKSDSFRSPLTRLRSKTAVHEELTGYMLYEGGAKVDCFSFFYPSDQPHNIEYFLLLRVWTDSQFRTNARLLGSTSQPLSIQIKI